ncbi:PEP-CTERM sorting domain-containing protein [Chamaesiphon sp. VAR_48_metabat_135_sub]|uniref:PEP-CTERM sorting domain-containing protein n=1 Tax=Chamaesiphon sp. VAR_48_metabat_135_sub TaxID=2964699 RepID=UPI002869ED44|nr:PEP-CTERM sorting domain-containing protein [Chamaesiphon sp. VAR_48_metabat_135_sub]
MTISQLKDFSKLVSAAAVFGVASLGTIPTASAAILKIGAGAFNAQAGLITFSEKPLGTVNPVYTPGQYGGGASAPTVSFGGIFTGQTVGTAPIPPGATPSGVVNGIPTGPLSLGGPNAFISSDGSNPTSPVLSGTPLFNGPISILFDTDQAGVGLDGGFFDSIGSTAITAFSRNGTLLGSVLNSATGIEFLGLVTSDGSNQIAGLQFSLVGAESAGFAIDNLRFGTSGQVNIPGAAAVPEPFTIIGTLVGGTAALRMRKKLKSDKA